MNLIELKECKGSFPELKNFFKVLGIEKPVFMLHLFVIGKKLSDMDPIYGNVKRISFVVSEKLELDFLL